MKSLKVPYFKQSTLYTCGPVSLQMVLSYYGIEENELDLATQLGTVKDVGTDNKLMVQNILDRGLSCWVKNEASIEDLAKILDKEVPIIVRFIEPTDKDDHFLVVVGMDGEYIYTHNPYPENGKEQKFTHQDFLDHWTCHDKNLCHQWLMAVSREPLIIDYD